MYKKGGVMADKLNLQKLTEDDPNPVEDVNPINSESSVESLYLHEFWEDYSKRMGLYVFEGNQISPSKRRRTKQILNQNEAKESSSAAKSPKKKQEVNKDQQNKVTSSVVTTNQKLRAELQKQFEIELVKQLNLQRDAVHESMFIQAH